VGGWNAEFLETRMNIHLLRQLAENSGGKYYDPQTIGALPHDLAARQNFRTRTSATTSENEVWNASWMLVVIITFISLEWILRKRSGML
jgi:hypothetical protein